MSEMPEKVLKEFFFVKRGSAYFRVHGEGILQVIKYEKRSGNLNVGLFSMYSELRPQWFTSSGCIPRYSIEDIANQIYPTQSECLVADGLPWLDDIDTQRKMLDALFSIETKRGEPVRWIDELKIAPFLMCQDYVSAEKVITAILDNHQIARKVNRALYSNNSDYQKYVEQRIEEDLRFLTMLDMVQQRDEDAIKNHLAANYNRNSRLGKFCATKKD